jgi:hypothetical protein
VKYSEIIADNFSSILLDRPAKFLQTTEELLRGQLGCRKQESRITQSLGEL